PLRSPLNGFEVIVAQERRQLHEPARRVLSEHADDLLTAGVTAETAERLEDRQIRLAGAVVLHALAPTDAQRRPGGDLREERIHERGLADSRLAGDEDELPPPIQRSPEPVVKPGDLGVPADERGARGRSRGVDAVLETGARRRSRARPGDRSDEAEAASMHRL